jgi:hypothetical protein
LSGCRLPQSGQLLTVNIVRNVSINSSKYHDYIG